MAINSSRHFYPTTVTTTTAAKLVDSLGSSSLRFLSYSSSISLRYHFGAASGSKKVKRLSCDGSGTSRNSTNGSSDGNGDWLENWNRNQKHNQPKPPKVVVNHRNEERFPSLGLTNTSGVDDSGGSSTMEKIVEKLKNYGFVDDDQFQEKEIEQERRIEKGSVEDIFYVEEGNLPNTRGGFSEESPFKGYGEAKFPWEKVGTKEKKEMEGEWTAKKESRYSLAEMTLPQSELNRLRNLMFRTKSKMRVKGAGVTQAVVDAIQEKWKSSEIVRLKIEGAGALNMRRMHEILEVYFL